MLSHSGATVLSHESYRDGRIGPNQQVETRESVRAHWRYQDVLARGRHGRAYVGALDRDQALDFVVGRLYQQGIIGEEDIQKYIDGNYDSNGDFWKLMNDGRIVFDGNHDLNTEDGKLLVDLDDEALGQNYLISLSKITGKSVDELLEMRKTAGYGYTRENGKIQYHTIDKYGKRGVDINPGKPSSWLNPAMSFVNTGDVGLDRIASWLRSGAEIKRKQQTRQLYLDKATRNWPAEGRITSRYGMRYNPFRPGTLQQHPGLDIANVPGTPIYATGNGIVVHGAGDKETPVFGKYVAINHGAGVVTFYNHNRKRLVETGQKVYAGQQVAEMGTTGNSTGTHLDYMIRVDGEFSPSYASKKKGSTVNPEDYLPRYGTRKYGPYPEWEYSLYPRWE